MGRAAGNGKAFDLVDEISRAELFCSCLNYCRKIKGTYSMTSFWIFAPTLLPLSLRGLLGERALYLLSISIFLLIAPSSTAVDSFLIACRETFEINVKNRKNSVHLAVRLRVCADTHLVGSGNVLVTQRHLGSSSWGWRLGCYEGEGIFV